MSGMNWCVKLWGEGVREYGREGERERERARRRD